MGRKLPQNLMDNYAAAFAEHQRLKEVSRHELYEPENFSRIPHYWLYIGLPIWGSLFFGIQPPISIHIYIYIYIYTY